MKKNKSTLNRVKTLQMGQTSEKITLFNGNSIFFIYFFLIKRDFFYIRCLFLFKKKKVVSMFLFLSHSRIHLPLIGAVKEIPKKTTIKKF
jgi:hypothetical protein